jgi:flagella basal body P-ring formation protein FlgA
MLIISLGLASYSFSSHADEARLPLFLDQIDQAVKLFLQNSVSDDQFTRHESEIDLPDPRLNLPACESLPSVESRTPQRRFGRLSLAIACPGPQAWTLFVAAQLSVYREVAVAQRPIPRGSYVSPDQIQIQEQDVTQATQGYYTQIKDLIGALATRSIAAGRVITPGSISPPRIVNRGERVTIMASSDTLSIKATGVSLADAAFGELVQVRNTSSNKVVEGRVTGPGMVSISF